MEEHLGLGGGVRVAKEKVFWVHGCSGRSRSEVGRARLHPAASSGRRHGLRP